MYKDVYTTAHILAACKVALQQGRYTFRHDTVLHQAIEALLTFISNIKEAVPISAKPSIMFVKKEQKCLAKGLLQLAFYTMGQTGFF